MSNITLPPDLTGFPLDAVFEVMSIAEKGIKELAVDIYDPDPTGGSAKGYLIWEVIKDTIIKLNGSGLEAIRKLRVLLKKDS